MGSRVPTYRMRSLMAVVRTQVTEQATTPKRAAVKSAAVCTVEPSSSLASAAAESEQALSIGLAW